MAKMAYQTFESPLLESVSYSWPCKHPFGGWSNERKGEPLDLWVPHTTMVSATIKFAIAIGRLEDRSKGRGEEESDEDVSSADEDEDA